MTLITVPDGCKGIDDPSTGRTYRPKRGSGVVEISDNPAFARASKKALGEVGMPIFADIQVPTWQCPGCMRTNWEKDDTCRRCGRSKP